MHHNSSTIPAQRLRTPLDRIQYVPSVLHPPKLTCTGYELNKRLATPIGTPERPLSDLGQRSYRVFWLSIIVRYLRLHFSSPPAEEPPTPATSAPAANEPRRSTRKQKVEEKAMTLSDLAAACFLRTEDVATALLESGVPLYTRQVEGKTILWMSAAWVEELAGKVRVRNRILEDEYMLV